MKCAACDCETSDDYLIMSVMRIKEGDLDSFTQVPVVWCQKCYGKLAAATAVLFDKKEES